MIGAGIGFNLLIALSTAMYLIPVMVAISAAVSIIGKMRQTDAKRKEAINLKVNKKDDLFHEGCRSEGHILHPEKSGFLKNEEDPFEY